MARAGFVLLVAGALCACESAVRSSQIEVTVTDSAGVEVFTSGEIPLGTSRRSSGASSWSVKSPLRTKTSRRRR